MPLEEYRRKRDFSATPEPAGAAADGEAESPALSFVVQKHAATALHYDFRLELDGVLLSWAVPKGPSFDTHDKRLAVHVEDHPLEYGGFEGTIPAGEYGGGTVVVWDRGTWEPVGDAHAGLAKGDFKFELHGEKLHGRWVLVRMRPRPGEKRENWLLIKERDEFARPHEEFDVLAEKPDSVLSGRSVEQVAAAAVADDPPTPDAEPTPPPIPAPAPPPAAPLSAAPPDPASIELELATLVERPPDGPGWLAEAKYDGYRVLIALESGRARAFTRSHADWSDRFAPLCRAVEQLPADSLVLDGEAVVFDSAGVSRFELLQAALGAHPEKLAYAAFDLLAMNGHDLRGEPLARRKELLRLVLADEPATSPLRYADHVEDGSAALYAHACSAGLEGVVCKRADSRYIGGRGRDWQKIKCRHTQELVVGGVTEGKGSRGEVGSLLVGTWDGDRLVYAGRVGSGFDQATLDALAARLATLERTTSPFDPTPRVSGHTVRWVEPALVIEAAFREWTAEGVLRQPVFLGVREDKDPREVVREVPEAAETDAAAGAHRDAAASQSRGSSTAPGDRRGDFGKPVDVLGVRVTNPEKPLFPDSAFPKLSLAEYYAAVAPAMLPHVSGRALTLVRCPLGHGRACFYQRHPDAGLPSQVKTFSHVLTGHAEPDDLLVVEDAGGLVALAQMGALEIHTWLSHIEAPTRPDRIVFDLDPGPGVTWPEVCSAARTMRDVCAELGFEVFVKSTGSKGLHVVLPIEPVWEFVRVRALAKSLVDRVVRDHPSELTGKMAKNLRGGRIFLDYLRNSEGASAIAPYSTRNLSGPSCSVPLDWDELADDLDIRAFTPERVLARIAEKPDPWAAIDEAAVGARVLKRAETAGGARA